MRRTVYLHLGYPKTATTFLQRKVFPEIQGIRYLGRHLGLNDNIPFITEWTNALGFASKSSFNARINTIGNLLAKAEKDAFKNIDVKTPIFISDEGLLFRTLQPFEITWFGKYNVCFENLLIRIKHLFNELDFDIKIILTLRNQPDLIHSLYSERYFYYSKIKRVDTFDKYLKTVFEGVNYFDYGLDNLEFENSITKLKSIIGDSNVLILKYECLKENPKKFFSDLIEYLNSQQKIDDFIIKSSGKADNVREFSDGTRLVNYKATSKNDKTLRFLKKFKYNVFGNLESKVLKSIYKRIVIFKSGKALQIKLTPENINLIKEKYRQSNLNLYKINKEFTYYE